MQVIAVERWTFWAGAFVLLGGIVAEGVPYGSSIPTGPSTVVEPIDGT